MALGRPSDARTSCDRALSIQESLVKAKPADIGYRTGLAESLLRSGQVTQTLGDAAGAVADWRRAITIYEGLPPRLHDEAVLEARFHAMLSGVAGFGMTASDGVLEAERAMDIFRGIVAAGYRAPALNPLRARPDFQRLIMDVTRIDLRLSRIHG